MDPLKAVPLTHGLGVQDREALARIARIETLPDGTCLGARGTPPREVFLLLEGRCLGLVPSRGGKDLLVDRIMPGRVLGELAVLDGGARVRTVRSDGPVRVARIGAEAFRDWIAARPRAMRNLLAELASNTREMTDRFYEIAVHDVETRVRLFLIRALIEAGALKTGGVLDPAPSHGEIADHVVTNREAVSRAMSRFNRLGFIDSGRRRVVVRDAAALESGVQGAG
ncbi:Crp/Fnr family transcriptional regulator [Meridianimarinicoccus sp. RP-17]|uniref:Crp/Fnr family transcriptional regulator n=1 Tax=Meridianimarinicoccus zhengii TaxID=2056810 RepID=UPI000DAEF63B|nr:Crp/Fnr family transcriptional regulator [Phycocomes zhengii]